MREGGCKNKFSVNSDGELCMIYCIILLHRPLNVVISECRQFCTNLAMVLSHQTNKSTGNMYVLPWFHTDMYLMVSPFNFIGEKQGLNETLDHQNGPFLKGFPFHESQQPTSMTKTCAISVTFVKCSALARFSSAV